MKIIDKSYTEKEMINLFGEELIDQLHGENADFGADGETFEASLVATSPFNGDCVLIVAIYHTPEGLDSAVDMGDLDWQISHYRIKK